MTMMKKMEEKFMCCVNMFKFQNDDSMEIDKKPISSTIKGDM